MIPPLLQDDSFLADVASSMHGEGLRIWWLGQSGFLLQFAGRHLLIDPYLSDSLTRKYANTAQPYVRMTERVLAPEKLNFIDVIACTHDHADHMDAETLLPLFKANPEAKFVIPEASRTLAADLLKIDPAWPIGLDDGKSVRIGDFEIHGIASAHNNLERDEHGRYRFLGYVIRCGKWTVYHSGDTLRYPDLTKKLREFSLDVAILPISGNLPERSFPGCLDGGEAAKLAKDIRAEVVIPCHYEMFEFNTLTPDYFISQCWLHSQCYAVLRAGEAWKSA